MKHLKEIFDKLSALEKISKPINESIEEETRTEWIVPSYLCEVEYASLASTGHLREPVFMKMWEKEF